MIPHAFGRGVMTLPQLDRVRWNMFPQVRVQTQARCSRRATTRRRFPDMLRVMDLQQEQLARVWAACTRDSWRGRLRKTMILNTAPNTWPGAHTRVKPILILCFNEPLAKIAQIGDAGEGTYRPVHVRNFHRWCRQQLVAFGQDLPANH